MHAIPTKYRGRQYRSRLEARWAAFMDQLGWAYEYEPFDLDGWIPDFVIMTQNPTLVEVKPFADEKQYGAKIERPDYETLLVGSVLLRSEEWAETLTFGKLYDTDWGCGWGDAIALDKGNGQKTGFCHSTGSWAERFTGEHRKDYNWYMCEPDGWVLGLWYEAGNIVQWKRPRSNG